METVKIKVSELSGVALDWCVAKCEHSLKKFHYGDPCYNKSTKKVYETQGLQQIGANFAPSTNWAQGGSIIEREGISVMLKNRSPANGWIATYNNPWTNGPTPLIAAMRCYVASKLGDVVEIPQELV